MYILDIVVYCMYFEGPKEDGQMPIGSYPLEIKLLLLLLLLLLLVYCRDIVRER